MMETEFRLAGEGGLISSVVPGQLTRRPSVRIGAILFAWVPLLVLTVMSGVAVGSKVHIPFLLDPVPHTRFLLALPVLILAIRLIERRLAAVVSYIWGSGMLVGEDRDRFQEAIRVFVRRSALVPTDVLFLVAAYALAWTTGALDVRDDFSTWVAYDRGAGQRASPAGWWYTLVSMPLYQFVIFRWGWRLVGWWHFLWKFSRLDLHLLPTHPDRAGGLGILQMGQSSFVILVTALSAVVAGNLADAKIRDGTALVSALPSIAVYVVLGLLLIVGPMLLFVNHMAKAKHRGLVEYGDLADDLFGAFERKWIEKSDAEQQELLGNTDPSSLADYGYAHEVVTEMKFVPFDLGTVLKLALVILAPFAPLLLMEHSWAEVATMLLGILK